MSLLRNLIENFQELGATPIGRWKRLGIGITSAVLALMIFMLFVPTSKQGPIVVEASCAAIPDATLFLQQADDPTEALTIILALPDGTPLVGICVTFTRDLGPGSPPEIIGTCTSDDEGRCTVRSPGGEIHVHFGNTRIGGFPFDDSHWANNAYLFDATSGGIAFYFEADTPSVNYLVASLNDSFITMGHAVVDTNGSLIPLTGSTSGGIPIPVDPDGGGPDPDPDPPTGRVAVEFHPTILRTAESFDRVYCYYAIQEQSYVRTPVEAGTFLPGWGSYFDVGAVLSASLPPAFILDADDGEPFNVAFQCWGWQGNVLSEIGVASASNPPDEWDGRELVIGSGQFTLTYTIIWYPLDHEPSNPRLTGDNTTRFSDEISIPVNVQLVDEQIVWAYNANTPIGGFRIYRNKYLIGTVGANARGWSGDGISVRECGTPTEFQVTAFLGGQESYPSAPAILSALDCAAIVRVNFDEIRFSNLEDCDGTACGTASEMYGYFSVNDNIIPFGQTTDPPFIGVLNERTYHFPILLDVFDISPSVAVAISETTPVTIEVVLFDHDVSTSDDVLCSWQTMLEPRETGEWHQQNGTVLHSQSTRNPEDESDCTFSALIEVQ